MKPYTANRSCDPGACRHPRNATITPNTDVLWWLIKRVLDKPFSDIMREQIWSKLGTERDTSWVVGPTTVEASGSRLITTLRDIARFGQMMMQKGRFNGQQIVPIAVVEIIEWGADRGAFARGPVAGPSNKGFSYHQWWVTHNEHGAYLALGYGGQIIYVDPTAQLVVAKFSSYPTPTAGGVEFFHTLSAINVLAKVLAQ